MEEIIKSNSGLILMIIALLATVGVIFLFISFLDKWHEVGAEARDNKKLIEYYGLVLAAIAILLSIFSIIYSNLNSSKNSDLNKRVEVLEDKLQ